MAKQDSTHEDCAKGFGWGVKVAGGASYNFEDDHQFSVAQEAAAAYKSHACSQSDSSSGSTASLATLSQAGPGGHERGPTIEPAVFAAYTSCIKMFKTGLKVTQVFSMADQTSTNIDLEFIGNYEAYVTGVRVYPPGAANCHPSYSEVRRSTLVESMGEAESAAVGREAVFGRKLLAAPSPPRPPSPKLPPPRPPSPKVVSSAQAPQAPEPAQPSAAQEPAPAPPQAANASYSSAQTAQAPQSPQSSAAQAAAAAPAPAPVTSLASAQTSQPQTAALPSQAKAPPSEPAQASKPAQPPPAQEPAPAPAQSPEPQTAALPSQAKAPPSEPAQASKPAQPPPAQEPAPAPAQPPPFPKPPTPRPPPRPPSNDPLFFRLFNGITYHIYCELTPLAPPERVVDVFVMTSASGTFHAMMYNSPAREFREDIAYLEEQLTSMNNLLRWDPDGTMNPTRACVGRGCWWNTGDVMQWFSKTNSSTRHSEWNLKAGASTPASVYTQSQLKRKTIKLGVITLQTWPSAWFISYDNKVAAMGNYGQHALIVAGVRSLCTTDWWSPGYPLCVDAWQASCFSQVTPSRGGDGPLSLGQFGLNCPAGYLLSGFELVTEANYDMHYLYSCCKIPTGWS
ncbi:hypothetical protein HYH03_012371 [Edaphochlamys debaryana]|uniref:Uncharacterized protein n=1 Tax=Edaphochlamys debaryana TaxID=47281 RepID=A0A836BU80_9CHLO|nr:hypothetical protein HYH03_012371 [Edaphochlamys debaryana]|eukprot:KAG2489145.1 hypothetical protein HYH03_012371 [Edaphochlamys debaryana]